MGRLGEAGSLFPAGSSQFRGTLQLGQRVRGTTERTQHLGELLAERGVTGFQTQRRLVGAHRFRSTAHVYAGDSQPRVRVGVLRRELHRRLELGDGIIPTSDRPQYVAEVDAGREEPRRQTYSLGESDHRLARTPRFGERLAQDWLDVARYADTHGFNNDSARSMWRWRDWVIESFNANMPFDRFVTEQLAGDLLPDRTEAQLVASGFNRNHMITHEGGTIPEENVVRSSDFLLLHANGVKDPARITAMVQKTRAVPGYKPMPILFNEDDHENFDQVENNFASAVATHVSWGWFDYRRKGEALEDGYQSPPVNWGRSSARKKAFFKYLAEITGSKP